MEQPVVEMIRAGKWQEPFPAPSSRQDLTPLPLVRIKITRPLANWPHAHTMLFVMVIAQDVSERDTSA